MKKENKKLYRGITLISLVITIVILIILAGIAINLTIGENGLFIRAKQAKKEYINAEVKEQDVLSEYANSIDSHTVIGSREYFEETILWEGSASAEGEEIELSDSWKKYKSLVFVYSDKDTNALISNEILASTLNLAKDIVGRFSLYGYSNHLIDLKLTEDDTIFKIHGTYNYVLRRVVGLK